jgi:iron complex transport system substrate-binding protein
MVMMFTMPNNLRPTRRTPRRASAVGVVGALVVAIAALAAACGGSDRAATTSTAGDSSTAGASGPVTIEHRYGSTTLDRTPTRIVSLDVQWTDALLALGTPPVGYIADPNVPDGFPWRGKQLAGSTAMHATDALPYEQIAALRPDLIVVTYFAQDAADYRKLSAIAPTIATLSKNEVDTWQDITRAAGKVLRKSTKADEVVAGVDGKVTDLAAELPGLKGRTFALANYVAGDAIYVVSDPADGSVVLFTQLGMRIAPDVVAAGSSGTGRAKISLERVDLLGADLLLLLANGTDPTSIPGYSKLPEVGTGAAVDLDYSEATAINTPTPLSIPWVLAKLTPALTAAAR